MLRYLYYINCTRHKHDKQYQSNALWIACINNASGQFSRIAGYNAKACNSNVTVSIPVT